MNRLFKEEYHAHPIEHQPILLSSAAVSAEKDSHRKPTSRPASDSSTAIRSCRRSSAATTPAHAVQAAAFKNCCLKTGSYDGERRNHFFQRLAVSSVGPISRGRCMRRPSMPCFRRERDRRFTRCNRRGVGESSPGSRETIALRQTKAGRDLTESVNKNDSGCEVGLRSAGKSEPLAPSLQ